MRLFARARDHKVRQTSSSKKQGQRQKECACAADGERKEDPMKIIADIDGDGLGCLHWWDEDEDEEAN
jgi:hypothetical protein